MHVHVHVVIAPDAHVRPAGCVEASGNDRGCVVVVTAAAGPVGDSGPLSLSPPIERRPSVPMQQPLPFAKRKRSCSLFLPACLHPSI